MESSGLVNQRMLVKKAARAVQIPEDVIQNYMEHPVSDEEVNVTRLLAAALVTLSDRADALVQKVTKMESYAKHMKIILHASLLASKELIPDMPSVTFEGNDDGLDDDDDDGDGASKSRPRSGLFGLPKHLLVAPRRGSEKNSEKRKSERRASTDSTPTIFFENPLQPFALVNTGGGGGGKTQEAGSTSELQRLLLDKDIESKRNSSSTNSSGGGDGNGEDDDSSPRQNEAMATFEF